MRIIPGWGNGTRGIGRIGKILAWWGVCHYKRRDESESREASTDGRRCWANDGSGGRGTDDAGVQGGMGGACGVGGGRDSLHRAFIIRRRRGSLRWRLENAGESKGLLKGTIEFGTLEPGAGGVVEFKPVSVIPVTPTEMEMGERAKVAVECDLWECRDFMDFVGWMRRAREVGDRKSGRGRVAVHLVRARWGGKRERWALAGHVAGGSGAGAGVSDGCGAADGGAEVYAG